MTGPSSREAGDPRSPEGFLRLGVLGTLVRDTIIGHTGVEDVEDWGGIAYPLAALDAVLDPAWSVVPMVKVGADLSRGALSFLESFDRVAHTGQVRVVAEDNNRVELCYSSSGRRVEQLRGGVPPWTWAELSAGLADVDALYVNFISGFEMPLDVAGRLAADYAGPTYADLHSLFLGIDATGRRFHRPLPDADAWAGAFDSVQVNEDEFRLLSGDAADPWAWAREVVGRRPRRILVTLGSMGAALVDAGEAGARTVRVPCDRYDGPVDPTGCGDVWGATFFSGLLAGNEVISSMERANRVAGRNLTSHGASELRRRRDMLSLDRGARD